MAIDGRGERRDACADFLCGHLKLTYLCRVTADRAVYFVDFILLVLDGGRDLLGGDGEVGDVLLIVGHALGEQRDVLLGLYDLRRVLGELTVLVVHIYHQRVDFAEQPCRVAQTYHAQDVFSVQCFHNRLIDW